MLAAEDFNNDKKDAGEIGAGHTVTALYEVVPVGVGNDDSRPAVDDLKYQSPGEKSVQKPEPAPESGEFNDELLTLKLRYKKPDGDTSKLLEFPLKDDGRKLSRASDDFRFAAAVAGFGMLLKDSEHVGHWTFQEVRKLAQSAKGEDREGYRAEFINLIEKADRLSKR
jgi:Ca-activated chloride channel family protein